MRQNGFSLIELIVVMSIIGILLSIATLNFSQWQRKSGIENQTKMLYSDLMTVRSEALFRKQDRSITLTATQFSVFPGNDITAPPVLQRNLSFPVTWLPTGASLRIDFDTRGIPAPERSICVEPDDNPGTYDSIVVSSTRIKMGKRQTGGACKSDGNNIDLK